MSGICGVVMFGSARSENSEIEAVLEPLKVRGPDGARIWSGEGVVLGHTLLATTPESLVEELPLHHEPSGCSVTADVRLDNRGELLGLLGVAAGARSIGDGELILRAYLRWGEDCVDHLLGDFAFAVWDARQRRLFCARDQMGMRQLAYAHIPGRLFVFATEPAALLRYPMVAKDLNFGRIADFLDNMEHFSLSETFYAAVSRLPPGHALTIRQENLQSRRYWELATPPQLKLRANEEYVEAFLEVFRRAVKDRLRSPAGVGAMLSGGMDSGSVVVQAAKLLASEGRGPLSTFSVVGPNSDECPETRAIKAAASMTGIEPLQICIADMDPYRADLIRLTEGEAEPFDGHMGLLRAVYLAAHRKGLKVVLDGVAGDLALQSSSYVARLLRRGRFAAAAVEAAAEANFWGGDTSFVQLFTSSAARAWIPRGARLARRKIRWWIDDLRIGRAELISRDFARHVELRQRRRQLRRRDSLFDRLDKDERRRRIAHANLVLGRERYDRAASQLGIEPRDPFIDVRLINFCLSLPWDQLQSDGWPKILLRRAMARKLPEAVRWRRGKEHLGWAFTKELFRDADAFSLSGWEIQQSVSPYVNFRWTEDETAQKEFLERCPEWIDAILLGLWLNSIKSAD